MTRQGILTLAGHHFLVGEFCAIGAFCAVSAMPRQEARRGAAQWQIKQLTLCELLHCRSQDYGTRLTFSATNQR